MKNKNWIALSVVAAVVIGALIYGSRQGAMEFEATPLPTDVAEESPKTETVSPSSSETQSEIIGEVLSVSDQPVDLRTLF